MNCELPDLQAGFRKGRGTWDQIDNICWIMESKRVPEKHLLLLYWPCQSLWLCGSLQTWKILKEMGIPEHLTCLLRSQYAGQEAPVRTGHETTNWFQIGKGIRQGCILSTCLFNLYAEYIMRNARLDEAEAGIKTAGRNISNLRYANDTNLMSESEEELKSLLMKVKEENEKAGLKLNIQKTKSWLLVPTLHGKQIGKQWKQWVTLFWGAPKSLQMVTAAMKLKDSCSLEEKLWPT